MSGIAGIVNLDGRPVDPAVLENMLARIAHRGPDRQSIWIQGAVGLVHAALWTTAEDSLVTLPVEVPGHLTITGDVRLDNREELLESLGRSNSLSDVIPDCMLVVAAYEKWGEDCVDHLLGDFAFAIQDGKAQKLFCARDHMGVKPFYYAFLPGSRFVFGSEIKAVLCVPGIADTINEQRVANAFVHLPNDPVSTYYSEVSRLPAAHYLSLKNTISTRRYWRLDPDKELCLKSDQEYADGFREHFSRAVHCRLRSSYPIGSMLSGGMDSSSITCVARDWLKTQGKPKLHTFSAVFDEVRECDERPYINTVLEQGHCQSNFIVLDSFSPLHEAESTIWHLDEPLLAGNLYLSSSAYRNAQKAGVRVVLDGFDGDTTVSHGLGRLKELADSSHWLMLGLELYASAKNIGGEFWLACWWRGIWNNHPVARRVNRFWSEAPSRLRMPAAPMKASNELLINQHRTMPAGTPLCDSAIKCAGKAHKNRNHQMRGGFRIKAASRIELGGHITETGCG